MVVLVAALVTLAVGTWWSRTVLTDADRYLRAVGRLPASPSVRWISGRLIGATTRRRRFGALTRSLMGTPAFATAWRFGHGRLHRHRRGWKVATAMILLATAGQAVAFLPTRSVRR